MKTHFLVGEKRLRSRALALALAVCSVSAALTPRPAMAVFALEPTQWLNQFSLLINQFQDYAAYAEDVQRWQQQLVDMQRQIAKLRNMSLSLGFKQGQQWEKILNPDEYLVEEACGAPYGGGVNALLGGVLGIDLRGDVFQQQHQRCAGIQIAKNHRWNATVKFMEESKQEMERDFSTLQQQNASSSEVGDSNKAAQDAAAVATKYEMRMQNFQDEIKMYDIRIATLEQGNTAVGKAAMRGKAGFTRNLTTAAALTAALCREGQCEDGN